MEQAKMQFVRNNPLVSTAAASVLVLSLTGIGAITGLIPSARSGVDVAAPASGPTVTRPAVGTAVLHGAGTAASRTAGPSTRAQGATAPSGPGWGTVESVRVHEAPGQASGVGMVAGGVGGAVLGNQIGAGNGRAAMTVLGAAGGAYAGNAIEKNIKKQTSYRITVRLDDGSYRTFSQSAPPSYGAGERVRVENGGIARAG